jgi:hypothetical protein
VASDHRMRELEERYEDYKVYDNAGERIGRVDDLFVDEADHEEYIGVKMGFFGLKSTLIPMGIVRVNDRERTMEVAESKERVKDAPTFDDDDDITPEYEENVRRHFGLEGLEPSGERGAYGRRAGTATSGAAADAMSTEGRERGIDEARSGRSVGGEGREEAPRGGTDIGDRGGVGDEGFREGGGLGGSGPRDEPGDRRHMEDESYREGYREGLREGLREGAEPSDRGRTSDEGFREGGDRGDLGPSVPAEGTTRRGADEPVGMRGGEASDRERVEDERHREGGPGDRATGPGDESRETARRSDEREGEESGITRVWRRIRN